MRARTPTAGHLLATRVSFSGGLTAVCALLVFPGTGAHLLVFSEWLCHPQNSHVETLTPKVRMVFPGGDFGR